MKNIVLASTSTLFGEKYLAYLSDTVQELFKGVSQLLFVPYARPGGINHDDYTKIVADFFKDLHMEVRGLHTFQNPLQAIEEAEGIFTGGGNTFLLVQQLHELKLMFHLKKCVEKGTPYLGTSAGSNIGGVNMKTTNDMPIVYPPSFETMGLIPFNINAHYLDPTPELKHNGETRETRIKEFHTQNNIPVVGLREGSWIRLKGNEITLEGSRDSRIFEKDKIPYELPPFSHLNFHS